MTTLPTSLPPHEGPLTEDGLVQLLTPAGERVPHPDAYADALDADRLRRLLHASVPGTPERQALHMRYALAVRAARNTEHGPWIAAALPKAAERAETGAVPLRELRGAAALTDGAARYVERYDQGGWPDAMRLMAAAGPSELIRRVRQLEAGDPDCTRGPRGKRSDDATALYAKF